MCQIAASFLLQSPCQFFSFLPTSIVLCSSSSPLYLYCFSCPLLTPCPFFPHLALPSSDIVNQVVIDSVSPSLSTSVHSLTLFFSATPLRSRLEQSRRPFCNPVSRPSFYSHQKCSRPDSLIVIIEKMKSQNTPLAHTCPASRKPSSPPIALSSERTCSIKA